MATSACECGEPTHFFEVLIPPDYEKRRLRAKCRKCGRKYAFVLPGNLTRQVLPPIILKTHMEGDVIVVDHWKDSQGEVGG